VSGILALLSAQFAGPLECSPPQEMRIEVTAFGPTEVGCRPEHRGWFNDCRDGRWRKTLSAVARNGAGYFGPAPFIPL